MGAHKSDHSMETGTFWSCHVLVTAATPHELRYNWGGKGGTHSSSRYDPVEMKEFCLDDVRGPVCTTWKVIIPHSAQSACMIIVVSKDTA